MSVAQNKIISIDVNRKKKKVDEVFNSFINIQSDNTKGKYERVIKDFFKMVYNKELSDITPDDLEATEVYDVRNRYFTELIAQGYKKSTVMNYASIVRSFLSELERSRVFFDEDFYDYERLRDTVLSTKHYRDDTEERKTMGSREYELFYDWLANGRKWSKRYKHLAEKYQAVLEFMHNTAIRIDATFKIQWHNIKFESDHLGNQAWVVYAEDKGDKVNKKPISNDYYDMIKETFYQEDTKPTDYVFGELSKRTFQDLCKQFSDETGFKITAHSIKNGAVTALYNRTLDPYQVMKFADHESLETTMKYIRRDNSFLNAGSYILSSNISIDILNKIEYNDIIDVVNENPEIAYQIINKLKKKGKID